MRYQHLDNFFFCHLTDRNNCCKKANQIHLRHFRKLSNSRCYFPSSHLPCYHCLIQQAKQELIQPFQGHIQIRVIQSNLEQSRLASLFNRVFLPQNETHPSSPSTSKFRDKHFLYSAQENTKKLSFAVKILRYFGNLGKLQEGKQTTHTLTLYTKFLLQMCNPPFP